MFATANAERFVAWLTTHLLPRLQASQSERPGSILGGKIGQVATEEDSAFRSAVIGAWITTRMEKDRTLLALATGGIGFLATLLMTVGPSSWLVLMLYGAAGVSFLVAIVAALNIFDRNGPHLEDVLRNRTTEDDPTLQRLDRVLFGSFMLGVALTCIIAALSGYLLMENNKASAAPENTTSKGPI